LSLAEAVERAAAPAEKPVVVREAAQAVLQVVVAVELEAAAREALLEATPEDVAEVAAALAETADAGAPNRGCRRSHGTQNPRSS
jgi:hypothetical protein